MNNMYKEQCNLWLSQDLLDPDLTAELNSVKDNDDELAERFAKDLEFGTGGLRGIIGSGTNRMNIYTVARATQGLANYIAKANMKKSVAIGYDSRHKSELFARAASAVLAENGFDVYLYGTLVPTPMVSFAVRELGCSAGIMVTASHNPAKYNGYKAYGSDGCQMTDNSANAVLAEMVSLDIFTDVKLISFDLAMSSGKINIIDETVIEKYYEHVMGQQLRPESLKNSSLSLVYTPLYGAGNVPVRHVLAKGGIKSLEIVKEQELPNGDFPTCPYPNPESRAALELGLECCRKLDADMLLATDPDSDRVGIAVKDGDDYILPSGNEVALLLLDYIITARKESKTMPADPIFVKSIVTAKLAKTIAEKNGVECVDVLTGFKYIGEQILHLEQKGEENRFIFGCEESYGYLVGTYARDKDAVVASLLIAEMASYYCEKGSSIAKELDRIYKTYGYEINSVDSFEFEGLSGIETMKEIMSEFRGGGIKQIASCDVTTYSDYLDSYTVNLNDNSRKTINLPKSDIVRFECENCGVIVRPSGTEPKIKVYYNATGKTRSEAEQIVDALKTQFTKLLKR